MEVEPDVTVKVVFAVCLLVSPVASIECLPDFIPAGRIIVDLTLNFPFWSAFRLAGGLKAVLSSVKTTVSPGAQPLPFRVIGVDLPADALFGLMLILAAAANTGVAVNRKANDNRIAAQGTARRHLKNKRCIWALPFSLWREHQNRLVYKVIATRRQYEDLSRSIRQYRHNY